MTHPLPSYPPLFPPGKWWRLYLEALCAGVSRPEAVARANALGGIRPRAWMRFEVAGPSTLSVPVAGGASALKNRPAGSWRLAPGAERQLRKIRHTLATLYGSTPYFGVIDVIDPSVEYADCAALCTDAFHRVEKVLGIDGELLRSLRRWREEEPERLKAVCEAYKGPSDLSMSILDPLFRLGPCAIYTVLNSF